MKQILYAIVLLSVIYVFFKYDSSQQNKDNKKDNKGSHSEQNDRSDNPNENQDWLPAGGSGSTVKHTYYTLSYSEKHEQAEWVAYELTKANLTGERVKRNDNFRPDPDVKTGSASPNDYRGSGYDRGHLCPAADMAFNETAMDETFFMSNMSPQDRKLNHGVWRELEENTRDWAKKCKQLYVVTGPILKNTRGYIGKQNKVSIPTAYYRVLVGLSEPETKGIAYVIPNEVRDEPLDAFAGTIDEAEKLTGLDFFPNLKGSKEQNIEAKFDVNLWRYDQRRFQQRIEKWNKE
jgi:endonuclease G, mitochondrial